MSDLLEDLATAWRIFRFLRTQAPHGADISITAHAEDAPCAPRSEPPAAQIPPAGGIGCPEPSQGLSGGSCARVGLHNCGGEWKNHDHAGGTR